MLRFSLLLTCSLLTSTLIGQHTVFAMEPEGTLHQEPSSPKKIISFDSEKMTRACEAARLALGDAFLDNFEARNKPGAGHRQETNYYRIRTQAVTAFFEKTLQPDMESDLHNQIVNLLEGKMVDLDDHSPLLWTKGLWGNVKEALLKEGITFESLNVRYAE